MWKVTCNSDWDNINSKETPDFSVIWNIAQNNIKEGNKEEKHELKKNKRDIKTNKNKSEKIVSKKKQKIDESNNKETKVAKIKPDKPTHIDKKKHGVTKTNKSEKIVSKEKPPKEMKQKKQNNTPDKITPKLNNKKNDSKTQKIKTTELHTKQKRKIETVTESVSHKKQKLEQEILEKEYNLHNEESESDELSSGDVKDDMASESPDELIGNEDSDFSELQKNLQQKMIGARFRWLNEQLYTTSGKDSFKMFKENPNLFQVYHDGFRSQVESWSINPVEFFIAELKELPKKF